MWVTSIALEEADVRCDEDKYEGRTGRGERGGRSGTMMHLNGGPLSEILVRVLCPFACHGGSGAWWGR